MTDDPPLDPPDADEQRAALLHIIGYRHLQRAIRSSGTRTLGWGLVMVGLWYLAYWPRQIGRTLAVIHLSLGVSELITGLAKKLLPVPETFLLEALVLFGFAAANGYRYWEGKQAGRSDLVSAVIGAYTLFAAWQRVQAYRQLHRTRFRRPSGDQLRWFDELLAEIRGADPEADPNSLDLPTRPPVRVKLLGDTALVMSPGDVDPTILPRYALRIDREAPRPGERLPTGFLSVAGDDLGDFELDEFNWKNYAAWKTAGGDPPPPLVNRPAG